jgi:endonuclease/exonuclease/phosphatase family metal-dependent hydrolase
VGPGHVGPFRFARFALTAATRAWDRPLVRVLLLAAAVVAAASPALAAEQTVRGRRLVVRNDRADPAGHRVVATAREAGGPAIVGDPTVGGAVLEVTANGAHPAWQGFTLAQGTTRRRRPFWRAVRQGYHYGDPAGEQGPVRTLALRRTAAGAFRLKVRLVDRNGDLRLSPPDPGTDGALVLALGGGDTYCVRYGPEGSSTNDGDRLWKIDRVTAEGCPTAGSFLALSYNVAGLPQGLSGSDPETNTPLIGPLLNRYDLVLVQESWQTPDPNPLAPLRVYHEILAAASTHPYASVPASHPFGTDPTRPSAIIGDGLNRFSWLRFEPVIRQRWNGCHPSAADCLALKGFSVARTTLAPGVTVDVYNLHMEAGSAPEDDALRAAGAAQLAAFIGTFSAGRAVIVGGDFNLHTDEEPDASTFEALLADTGLRDVCATLACPEPGRIDKFLFRSSPALGIAPLSWRFETDVFVRDDGEPLSDHEALAVRFAWTAAGG